MTGKYSEKQSLERNRVKSEKKEKMDEKKKNK